MKTAAHLVTDDIFHLRLRESEVRDCPAPESISRRMVDEVINLPSASVQLEKLACHLQCEAAPPVTSRQEEVAHIEIGFRIDSFVVYHGKPDQFAIDRRDIWFDRRIGPISVFRSQFVLPVIPELDRTRLAQIVVVELNHVLDAYQIGRGCRV